jgi:hypothetical protein
VAFPTTAVLDTFTTAANPSPNWTDSPDGISYGGLRAFTGIGRPVSTDCYDYYNVITPGADCEIYATMTAVVDGTDLYLRLAPVGSTSVDGYFVKRVDASNVTIRRLDNDAGTTLGASISQAVSNGDGLGLEAVGTSLTAYYKAGAGSWGSLGSRTDATYGSAGRLGVYLPSTATQIDNFGGGTVVAASTVRMLASTGVGK